MDTHLISDKIKINYCLFPCGQVFSLGIRLMRLTIPRSPSSFKGEAFSFLSVFSAWHDFWNLGFFRIPNYVLSFSINKRQLLMCLHPSTNKWQLFSFRSLKNYHVLAFWPFIPQYQSWSLVCFSPPTHTWPIVSGVLPCPCQLVLMERVEERRPLFSLLILACHYSRPMAGELHLLTQQPTKCMRVSYFLIKQDSGLNNLHNQIKPKLGTIPILFDQKNQIFKIKIG